MNNCKSIKGIMSCITGFLVVLGAINWGLVGALDLDLVARVFGTGSDISRVIYVVIGLCGLWYGFRCASQCCNKSQCGS